MLALILLLLATSQALPSRRLKTTPVDASARVGGGSVAYHGQFPYQTYILGDGVAVHGGTLIAPLYVLTSASEASKYLTWTVYLGTFNPSFSEEERLTEIVYEIIVNPDYNIHRPFDQDLALLKFSFPVQYSPYIQPAALPALSEVVKSFEGELSLMSGWGPMTSGPSNTELTYIRMEVTSRLECNSIYGLITKSNLCASTHTSLSPCGGDVGGPLVLEPSGETHKLIGVLHYVPLSCTMAQPSVFFRVTDSLRWLAEFPGVDVQP